MVYVEIPKDVRFRLEFLEIYQTFGEMTALGQEDVYISLKSDFGEDPVAVGVICERPISMILTTSPTFPQALKSAVNLYQIALEVLVYSFNFGLM
jgi:hypothetical protein